MLKFIASRAIEPAVGELSAGDSLAVPRIFYVTLSVLKLELRFFADPANPQILADRACPISPTWPIIHSLMAARA